MLLSEELSEELPDELSEELPDELSEELPDERLPLLLFGSIAPVILMSKFCADVRLPSLANRVNDSVTVCPVVRLSINVVLGM